VGSSRRKCSPNAEPRADYFWNFRCSKAITKHQNQCNFLKKKFDCDTWWVSVGYHREKNNGKWNNASVPVGYLFSEMPHEILHFVNVPPNTRRKILEAFTDVMNICRGTNRGCGWTCSGLFENLIRFSQSYGTHLHLLHVNGMNELCGRFCVGYKISITNKQLVWVFYSSTLVFPGWDRQSHLLVTLLVQYSVSLVM
jgi:hypothetical protein